MRSFLNSRQVPWLVRVASVMIAAIAFASPANACLIAPPPVQVAWDFAPDDKAGEVVLQVRFLGLKSPGPLQITNSCGNPTFAVYEVLRVEHGMFEDDQVMLFVPRPAQSDTQTVTWLAGKPATFYPGHVIAAADDGSPPSPVKIFAWEPPPCRAGFVCPKPIAAHYAPK